MTENKQTNAANPGSPASGLLGCDYQGHEFGAMYLDSVCIEGFLWDADSGEGGQVTSGGDIPCPQCNHAAWLEWWKDTLMDGGYAAADDGKPESECPQKFGENVRPEDHPILKEWWLQGYRERMREHPNDELKNAASKASDCKENVQ